MEIKVKLTRPIGSDIHHRDYNDEHVLVYYLNKDYTLEQLMQQVRIDCEGLSKNFRVLFNGNLLNHSLTKTYLLDHMTFI